MLSSRECGFKDALEDKNANILELSLDSLLDREGKHGIESGYCDCFG